MSIDMVEVVINKNKGFTLSETAEMNEEEYRVFAEGIVSCDKSVKEIREFLENGKRAEKNS